ncbi:BTAD domain-containing putative transcriptional regulator [Frankia sp. Cj3]|uniref:BTAD domain-containing putative transcriptional regulator n=1 Tax=Frankia sp. Cj3 TaxID=2880976 RepID=UPI0021071F26|nr:BTAD domain-containing putative transcriptional regulator [Frankia sp. Cj3]
MVSRRRPRRRPAGARLGGVLTGFVSWLGWAALTLLMLVVLPVVVWWAVGWPLPHHLPTWEQVRSTLTTRYPDQRIYIDILACLFWYFWFTLAACFPLEAVAVLRGWTRPRLPLPGPGQALAAALIGGLLLHSAARSPAGPRSPGDRAALATVRAVATAPQLPGATSVAGPAAAGSVPGAGPQQAPAPQYTVVRGDTLWDIAGQQLGDPFRYRDLFQVNAGRRQPDGAALVDPNLIRPGWTLLLPAPAAPAAGETPARPDPAGTPGGPQSAGVLPAPAAPSPNPPAAAAPGRAGTPTASPAAPSPGIASAVPPTDPPATATPAPSAWTPTVPPPVTPPATAQAPPTVAPPTPGLPTPHPGDQRPAGPHHPHDIALPSGAVVGAGLLAAVAAAVTLARLHRHRRRPVPTPPGQPVRTDPPLPIIVREILRVSRTLAPDDEDDKPDRASPLPAPPFPVGGTGPPPAPPDGTAGLPGPLARAGSVSVDGPGAPAAARAILTTVLADHHRHPGPDRPWPARLIIPAGDVDRLALPRPVLAVLPAVTVTPTLPAALDRLDAEILHRHRLMDDLDTDSVTELRTAAPDEMLPTVLLVATVEEQLAGRMSALAVQGRPLGLHLLALGDWPGQITYILDADGRQTAPGDGVGERWWQLTPAAAGDLLELVAAAHDIHLHPPAAPPLFPVPVGRASGSDNGREPLQPLIPASPAPGSGTPSARQPDTPAGSDVDPDLHPDPPPEAAAGPVPTRRVRLLLFGRPTITIDGVPLTRGLRTLSLEVAAFLAVHPGGAGGDTLATELLAHHDPRKARNQIYRAIAVLRDVLTAATGDNGVAYLTSSPAGYRLHPDHVAVDLWEFHDARRHAGHARDDTTRIAALTRAADLYQARPLGDTAYDWSTPHIGTVEHQAVDILADLADLHAEDNPDRALTYLDQAITLTPHVEDLYCHAMRIHATRGRLDAVRRTYQRLRDALEPIDADPAPATDTLLARLTRDPPTPTIMSPAVGSPRRVVRPASRPGDPPTTGG